MTAQPGAEVPAPAVAGGGLRRRARVHLETPPPAVLPGVVGTVTGLATELGLGGFVRTDAHGVTVEVEGPADEVAAFLEEIGLGLVGIEPGLIWDEGGELPPLGATEFAVLAVSARRTAAAAHRGSDVALCEACVRALFDPADPRHGDPFLRCAGCRRDGPEPVGERSLRLLDARGTDFPGDPLAGAGTLLMAGRIVAVRLPDRYRLYADATRPAAVAAIGALTDRVRDGRRVALCPDIGWAGRLAVLSDAEIEALSSRRNPVLLVEPLSGGPADDLTPPHSLLALTLPGCALTHLLARGAGRPLAFVDLPPWPANVPSVAVPPAIGVLHADRG